MYIIEIKIYDHSKNCRKKTPNISEPLNMLCTHKLKECYFLLQVCKSFLGFHAVEAEFWISQKFLEKKKNYQKCYMWTFFHQKLSDTSLSQSKTGYKIS